MINPNDPGALPKGWGAFELNVLRRLKFDSIALPFAHDAMLGLALKRWGARVIANDLLQSNWTKTVAKIQNNNEHLVEEQAEFVLADAYVPRHRLYNPVLRQWFSETDAWWFDNIRNQINSLESPTARAIALSIGMAIGDYVLSFDQETLELRQPLSQVFRRLWHTLPAPVNNRKNNVCFNKEAREFVADVAADTMFLRLPRQHENNLRDSLTWTAWREDWVRGGDQPFWHQLELQQAGRLGAAVATKHQYLRLVEDFLRTAQHISTWAIAHIEDGFLSTPELIETVNRIRPTETVFSKDFSEIANVKAVILTAAEE